MNVLALARSRLGPCVGAAGQVGLVPDDVTGAAGTTGLGRLSRSIATSAAANLHKQLAGSNHDSFASSSNEEFDYSEEFIESVLVVEDDAASFECSSLFFLLDFSHQYYIPFIIMIGLVGNLLSCFVFLNTHLKMRSSSYYLAALASADFSFLFSLLLVWLNNTVGWRVFNKDGWCECVVYVSSVCSSLSVWLIVAFTVERFIAIQYPLHRPRMCTITRAKTVVFVLVLVAMISHSYVFLTAGLVNHNGFEFCDLKVEYLETMRIVSIIDSVASLMAPLVLIIVMNTMIMRNLFKFSKRFDQSGTAILARSVNTRCPGRERLDINFNQSVDSSSNIGENVIPLATGIGARRQLSQQSFESSKNNTSHQSTRPQVQIQPVQPISIIAVPSTSIRNNVVYPIPDVTSRLHVRSSSRNLVSTRNQQSITKMLLLISTVFILLNLPSYAIRLCVFFFTLARKDTPSLLWCLQQFFMLLYYTNFSINFLLYAMCGITFRRCLEQLLRKVLKSLTKYKNCDRQRYF